ncbi:MAG: transcription antitermination factor NusB [Eubacterium sp.]|jgi:N utilization substance protein B|nr:transcription antitermination factor NusB [Eubacterium sp.]
MTRSEIRECAFIILFQMEFNDYDLPELIEVNEESFGIETDNAVFSIINGVRENKDKLDAAIAEYSKTRSVGRIAKINITILRIAVYEMLYCDNVPPKAAINEAIELSKKYGGENDKGFISGLLGSFYRENYEKDGKQNE